MATGSLWLQEEPHCDAILRLASSALRPSNVSGKGQHQPCGGTPPDRNLDRRSSQCPSKDISVLTGTPRALIFLAPPRSGRSITKQAATTSAPIFFKSPTAPSAEPPVAMRSSTRITLSPGATASSCISITSSPYSSEYAIDTLVCGSLPFLRIGTKPAES